jgi:hypothetical protein
MAISRLGFADYLVAMCESADPTLRQKQKPRQKSLTGLDCLKFAFAF